MLGGVLGRGLHRLAEPFGVTASSRCIAPSAAAGRARSAASSPMSSEAGIEVGEASALLCASSGGSAAPRAAAAATRSARRRRARRAGRRWHQHGVGHRYSPGVRASIRFGRDANETANDSAEKARYLKGISVDPSPICPLHARVHRAMALRDILILPDKRLRLISEPVKAVDKDDPRRWSRTCSRPCTPRPASGSPRSRSACRKRVVTMDLAKKDEPTRAAGLHQSGDRVVVGREGDLRGRLPVDPGILRGGRAAGER